ncbi:terminase large subunit domain-containing protein [Actinobacillus equuli]|uniref:terminase large subunit domain-containing protein n=1 Tax=Actinobacillus equuli TaxID=718 RepID=UPI00244202A0|nr:terminase family protein [Actinobacillus equuli]WGE52388.1 terminase family protein [Actinobacillus equuli subsp. haemolyticus]
MALLNNRPLNELAPECRSFLESIHAFDPMQLLLGYQKRWIADDSQLKIAEKTRRCGLTWAEAADNALIASTRKADGGSDVFYIGSNKEMAREYIDAVAMWAKAFNYAASEIQEEVFEDEDKDILTYVIYFSSGFKVKALSSNPKNLRGMQGVVVIDEAAFHEYLAEVLKAALALTMWGAKFRIISTHNGSENLFNELITDSRAGRKRYSVHTITIEDACRDGLYQRICQVTKKTWSQEAEKEWIDNLLNDTASEEDALEEYFCVPKFGSGLWLSRALIERQMSDKTPVIRYQAKDGFSLVPEPIRYQEMQDWCESTLQPILGTLDNTQLHFLGEDFARSGDMTSFVVLAQQQNLTKSVRLIVELGNMPYKQQEQIVLFILKHLPRFAGAAFDARGNGGFLAESAQDVFGSLIDSVQLSEKWYREHTAPFKAALEDGELDCIPKDADILADLRSFQVVKGVPRIPDKRTKSTDGKTKRHGDTAISLLLAHYASRQLVQVPVKAYSRKVRRSTRLTQGY